jgi:hypothetical protein
MANIQAAFGFQHVGDVGGASANFPHSRRKIASNNATAIYRGDPVVGLTTGYIGQASAGTTQIAGIFAGCEYISTSQGKKVFSPYWPGSDATGDVTAFVVDAPNSLFLAASNGSPFVLADIGSGVNFAVGTGNTANGISGATLDQSSLNTTNTLPFKIVRLFSDTGIGNGADNTTNYNWAYATFNNETFKQLLGIA